jgi:transcriptional regulator with XRE-family HTH domain
MALTPETFQLDQARLGQILHEARLGLGMSLRDAAKLCGLSHTHILRIENGELEVSLRNFVRLSMALGFPSGLLIEGATLIGRGVFHPLNDDTVKKMALEASGNASISQSRIADFASGSALVVAYLIKASNPVFMVERFAYPVPDQKEVFRKLAQKIETSFSPIDRRNILTMLIADTVPELSALRLFTKEFVSVYLSLYSQKNPPVPLPWIPIPAPPFVDILQKPTANPHEVEARLLQIEAQEQESKRGPRKQPPKNSQAGLDKGAVLSDTANVKRKIRSLSELVSKLRKFTKVRGQKVAVARECHVTRQAVDQWLSGDAKPSAEATFELLNWVEQQERQK